MTKLPNRPLLADRMQQALSRSDRLHELVVVVCLDLDGFKVVNDTFGHSTGDALLVEVASRLLAGIRSGDTLARLGGDEFAILLCGTSSRKQAEMILQRILCELHAPYHLGGHLITNVSASIGYTLFPNDLSSEDTLLRHADQAMYMAKQAGKNRLYRFDVRSDKRAQASSMALARIEKAFAQNEFVLFIQPVINLRTGKAISGEVLIRWNHSIRGIVQPAEFLPLIDGGGLDLQLGIWSIRESLSLMQAWDAQGVELPLSINLSNRQFLQDDFCSRFAALLQEFPEAICRRLEIEIAESVISDDLPHLGIIIAECRGSPSLSITLVRVLRP